MIQCYSGGQRASSATSKVTLQPWLVGLAAVVGFLFIVFVLVIVQRLFFKKDKWVVTWNGSGKYILYTSHDEKSYIDHIIPDSSLYVTFDNTVSFVAFKRKCLIFILEVQNGDNLLAVTNHLISHWITWWWWGVYGFWNDFMTVHLLSRPHSENLISQDTPKAIQ